MFVLNRLKQLARRGSVPLTLEALSRQNEYPILSAAELIGLLGVENRIRSIRRLAGVDRNAFSGLYQPALDRYIEAAQLQPASMADHHAGLGGLVVHTLEVVELSMKVRRELLLPENSAPEIIRREEHCWSYAVFVAALLHDAGKLLTLTRLRLNNGQYFAGVGTDLLQGQATHYRIEHVGERYSLQMRVSVMLFGSFIPTIGQAMLCQNGRVLAQLTGWLSADEYEWGVLGRIVRQADSQSVAQNLAPGTRLEQLPDAPTKPLVERITQALRGLIVDGEITFNRSGGAGWADTQHVYLVCRTAADLVRQRLAASGSRDIPQDNTRLFDLWQDHGYLVPTAEGKAVWHLRFCGADYEHALTVLKFEHQRLVHPSRRIEPFKGTIEPANAVLVEAEANAEPAAEPVSAEPRSPTASKAPQEAGNEPGTTSASDPPANTGATRQRPSGALETLNQQLERAATAYKAVPYGPPVPLDHGDIGLYFLTWLRDGVAEKRLKVNEKDALVHTLPGCVAVVSPKIFHRFVTSANLVENEERQTLNNAARRVQNRLRKTTKVVITSPGGHSVRILKVTTKSTTSRLNVFVFEQRVVFAEGKVPEPNPILSFSDSEVAHND